MKDDFKYPYAKTDDDELICIKSINKDNRNDYHYYCYGCGKELVPVLGNIREHHFRHKEKSVNCDRNKYLHEFAKNKIKERFETSEHFYVWYNAKRKCKKKDECELSKHNWEECYADGLYKIDLKEFYDTCTLEKCYSIENDDERYIADLLLTNSKDQSRKPIGIEIWVTHECSEEKKQSKKNRIIEIKIEKESDALREIIEKVENELPIRFFNFKRYVLLDPSKKLYHCKIDANNNVVKDELLCSEMSFDDNSKYELYADIVKLSDEDKFNFVSTKLNDNGFCVPNCLLCSNMMICNSLLKIERCYIRGIEKGVCYKNKRYRNCPYYKYASNKGYHLLHKFKEILYREKK